MSKVKAITIAGLIAGTLDAVAAIVVYNADPIRMFQFIASGVLGKEAFSGGMMMAGFGLLFHLVIAFSWAAFYFLVYPKVGLLSKNEIASGLIFGILIWIIMNLIVLPMTRITQRPIELNGALMGTIILMFTVGVPIAWLAVGFIQEINKHDSKLHGPQRGLDAWCVQNQRRSIA